MPDTHRVVIAGGSGAIGSALADHLRRAGASVVVLSRRPGAAPDHLTWDGRTPGDWARSLDGADAVINLAGRSINCRWTPENRREIVESRVDSVRAIALSIATCAAPPRVWVQAAATGIYADTGDTPADERLSAGSGFLADVCRAWEEAFNAAAAPHTRKVLLRIGVVLDRSGTGMMGTLLPLARRGLGGAAGNGRQFISWIHIDDLLAIVDRALGTPSPAMHGVYNAVAPEPVRNRDFMRHLRRAVHRPWSPPVPALAVRLGARFMNTEPSLALASTRVMPRRLLDEGFTCRFPTLAPALEDLAARRY